MNNKMLSFLKKLFRMQPKIFLTSDLHLDHASIIKYCNRPFRNVHEMNHTLIRNWNKTVGKQDVVYFLGDLIFSRSNRQRVQNVIKSLNGKKIFIRGNHDKFIKSYHHFVLKYKGQYFYLVHNPSDIPKSWKSWVIFGHTHHKGKFIDKENKRINVSTELTGYKPVNLKNIIRLIEN